METTYKVDSLTNQISIKVSDEEKKFVFGMKLDEPVSTIKIIEKDLLNFLNENSIINKEIL